MGSSEASGCRVWGWGGWGVRRPSPPALLSLTLPRSLGSRHCPFPPGGAGWGAVPRVPSRPSPGFKTAQGPGPQSRAARALGDRADGGAGGRGQEGVERAAAAGALLRAARTLAGALLPAAQGNASFAGAPLQSRPSPPKLSPVGLTRLLPNLGCKRPTDFKRRGSLHSYPGRSCGQVCSERLSLYCSFSGVPSRLTPHPTLPKYPEPSHSTDFRDGI